MAQIKVLDLESTSLFSELDLKEAEAVNGGGVFSYINNRRAGRSRFTSFGRGLGTFGRFLIRTRDPIFAGGASLSS